jgi:hypothetical protein
MKKQTQEEQTRSELRQSYLQETGHLGRISGVQPHNDPLPTWAYLRGYRFMEFMVDARVDPYALMGPDGQVVKVWPEKPPSLTELREVIGE